MTYRLDIRQLQMLASIVGSRTIAAAADGLGLTPSALSHRLREAERRLGYAIFERDRNRLRLTPAGERIHRAAVEVLDLLQSAEAEAADIASGFTCSLKIGSRAYSSYRWLPKFLEYFRGRAPNVAIELLDGAIEGPLDALRRRDLDVLLLSGARDDTGLSLYPLFEDELVAVLPPGHASALKPWLDAEDFRNELYVTYSTKPEPGHEYELLFRRAGVMPRRILRAGLTEAIVELVRHGHGLTILARWSVMPYVASNHVIAKPLTARGLRVGWFAAVRADEPEQSMARLFAAELAAWCRDEGAHIGYSALSA